MNRIKDYLCFAVRFAGLGYVALWPVSTPAGGDLFGAALLCEGDYALHFVCGLPHPLQLGIGLHFAGALCAVVAVLHLVVRALCRTRPRQAAPAHAGPRALDLSAPPKPRSRRPMPPPRRLTQPRTHFGLRRLPQ